MKSNPQTSEEVAVVGEKLPGHGAKEEKKKKRKKTKGESALSKSRCRKRRRKKKKKTKGIHGPLCQHERFRRAQYAAGERRGREREREAAHRTE